MYGLCRCGSRPRPGPHAGQTKTAERPVRRLVTPAYTLKSGRQKCLKAEYGAKRHGRRDRTKTEKIGGQKTGKA